jgi:threonine dehydrogenase-like Zn-dependent dehydrogenase
MTTTIARTARVATLVAPRELEIFDQGLPDLEPADVLLETLYTGISAGTEMNVYRGSAAQWRTKRDHDTGLFERTDDPEWTYPMAYGYAAVSRVADVGRDVSSLSVGDLVFSYTSHASAAVVPASSVIPLPSLPDPRVGVMNANVNTAYNGVLDANPHLGDVVVVSGLGVIGLVQVQLLRRAGARVIGIDAVAHRRELATRFGAETVLAPGPDVAATIRHLTDLRGADIVIEVSGASPALNEAIRIVGYSGTVIAMSWYGGSFESLSLSGEFHHNRPRIVSSQVGGLPPGIGPLWSLGRRQQVVSQFLQELDLESLLTHERDIEDAAEAYRIVDSRPDDLVQFVLTYHASEEGAR